MQKAIQSDFVFFTMFFLLTVVAVEDTSAQSKLYDLKREGISVAFSPNGRYIATGDTDGNVSLWNVRDGEKIYDRSLGGEVAGVDFSPDGKYIAADGANGGVRMILLETNSGAEVKRRNLNDEARWINAVAYSPDGRYAAVGDDTGRTYLWNVNRNSYWWWTYFQDELYSVAFSPNGEYLATGDSGGYARLWEVSRWSTDDRDNVNFQRVKLGGNVRAVTFSPNGKYLAADGTDGSDSNLTLYEVGTDRIVQQIALGKNHPNALSFSPDGRYLAVGGTGREIIIYKIGTQVITLVTRIAEAMRIQTHGEVDDLAWSLNGEMISDGRAVYSMPTADVVPENPSSGIRLTLPSDLITEEAFGTDAIYFILKAQHPILTGVPGVNYGHAKIFLDIPIDREIFIFPIPSQTKTEEARDAAKDIFVYLLVDLIPIRIPLSGTLQGVWDLFSKVQEAKEEQNYKLRIDLENPFYGPEHPEKEVNYLVLLRQKLGVRTPLSGIQITIEQQYNTRIRDRRFETVKDTKFWRFREGWAAPAAHPVDISDYPPFQLLPPEVQQYLLLQFEDFLPAAEWLIPDKTTMDQNYPNPFNPETWIPYQLSESADVTVSIYSVDGKLVRTLALGHQAAGIYQSKSRAAYWNGHNEFGEPVASGLYFYTLTAGDFTATRKMLIRK